MESTDYQRRIVRTTHPYVEVVAKPGSGKTTTLVQRLAHLVRCGVSVRKISVLSFSNEAVDEIHRGWAKHNAKHARSRRAKVQTDGAKPVMMTAHAFARRVVGRAGGNVDVITPSDAQALLKSALQKCLKDARNGKLWSSVGAAPRCERIRLIHALLQNTECLKLLLSAMQFAQAARMKLVSVMDSPQFADDLERFAGIASAVQSRYVRAKRATGQADFEDLLGQAIEALKSDKTHLPFTHVLVDEYQDCSPAQSQLLVALVKCGCELMVFGDPEQAIYGFGGNGYTSLRQIVEGAKVMSLPESHRLHQETAALASAVVNARTSKIVTQRRGTRPVLVRSRDLTDQTQSVVRDIERLLGRGVNPSHIAVLARTRAFLAPVEQRLLASGLNAAQQGTTRDSRHAQRVLRLVALVEQHAHQQAPIDPDKVTHVLRKVTFTGSQPNWTLMARSLKRAARSPSLDGRYRACEDVYLRALGGVRANTEVHHDLNRWAPICHNHSYADEMLRAIKKSGKPVIQTMTIHASKGREWDHVFLVGVADGQLPLYLAKGTKMLAEERRLLYVAVTRARKSVRLYHAPVDHARSQRPFVKLSRFLSAEAVSRTMRVVKRTKPK